MFKTSDISENRHDIRGVVYVLKVGRGEIFGIKIKHGKKGIKFTFYDNTAASGTKIIEMILPEDIDNEVIDVYGGRHSFQNYHAARPHLFYNGCTVVIDAGEDHELDINILDFIWR